MAVVALLLALCSLAAGSFLDAGSQLLHVSVVYRHGDRSPQSTFPNDQHGLAAWPQGFGALTELGARQQLDLGRFLRRRYKHFINSTYVPSEISVRSSGFSRTLQSAFSNLAGFYNTSTDLVGTPNASWQPVPVYSVPAKQDTLLGLAPCKSRDRASSLENVYQSVEMRAYVRKYSKLVSSLSSLAGYKSVSLNNIATIYDSLYCQAKHNLSLPSWASWTNLTEDSNVTVLRVLEDLVNLVFNATANEVLVKRLSAGFLLDEITKNMQKSMDKPRGVKLAMYSAEKWLCFYKSTCNDEFERLSIRSSLLFQHDSTIAFLLGALDAFDGTIPRYAALVAIELWRSQENDSATAVRVYYKNGVEVVEPKLLQLPGCPRQCSLESFKALVSKIVPVNYAAECESTSGSAPHPTMFIAGKGTTIVISLAVTAICRILKVAS